MTPNDGAAPRKRATKSAGSLPGSDPAGARAIAPRSARPRVSRQRPRWRTRFLKALARWPNVSDACRQAGISRGRAYDVRREDATFREAWDRALDTGYGVLEDVALQRAAKGWLEPVFYEGKQVGTIPRFDSGLTKFLLAGRKRSVFGDRFHRHEHDHRISGNVHVLLPDNGRGPRLGAQGSRAQEAIDVTPDTSD